MSTSLALRSVSVCDAVVDAAQDERGAVWVVVRRLCDLFGLNDRGQVQRLQRVPWGGACVMHLHDVVGRTQPLVVIPLCALPMWLATVQVSRVREEARPTLERFQCEAADVLAAYFIRDSGQKSSAPLNITDDEVVGELRARLDGLALELLEMKERVAEGEARQQRTEKALASAGVQLALPYVSRPQKRERGAHASEDPLYEPVKALAPSLDRFRLEELLGKVGLKVNRINRHRLARILRSLGFEGRNLRLGGGKLGRARQWVHASGVLQ